MKKIISVLAAGLFLVGSLAALTGCASEIEDEARAAEIFAAVAQAKLTQYELTSKSEANYSAKDEDGTQKGKSTQEIAAKAYEKDGKLFADVFTDEYLHTEEDAQSSKTETRESYSVVFARDGEVYRGSGAWKDVSASKGNFSALVKELKKENKVLNCLSGMPSYAELDEAELNSFGALAPVIGGKAYKKGGGYLVELDMVACEETLLRGYESALEAYADDPYMTVSEFLREDFIAKYLTAAFSGASVEDAADALEDALWEQRIYVSSYDFPEAREGMNGYDYFMLCLDDEELFAEIMRSVTGERWTEGGTLGGARMSVIFGSASELLDEVRTSLGDVEGALLEEMFGFDNGEEDEGSLDFVVTVGLDGNLNVTSASLKLDYSMTEKPDEDTKIEQKGSGSVEIKVLEKAPALTDLAGLKADMGKQFDVGTYAIPETSARLYLESYDTAYGTYHGSITVTDDEMIVEVVFQEENDAFSITERREYGLNGDSFYDMDDLFMNWELPNGDTVSRYGGLSYYLSASPSTGYFYFSMSGLYDFEIPSHKYVKDL